MTVALGTLGPKVRKAKTDGWAEWIRNEHDEQAVRNGCRFDIGRAEHYRTFARVYLRHSKGRWARQPFELLDWEWHDVAGPAFGWLRPDGTRRIRTVYVEVPKKTGKSTFGATVGNYLLVGDGEPGAEVYSAATKQEQASIVHGEAINMVAVSKPLLQQLRINRSTKVISYPRQNARYAALCKDAAGSEGLNIHGLIIDEMHVWSDRGFWDSLRYGGIARTQPLTLILTTAGVYDKTSLGWEQHEYARKWLAGEVENQEYLTYIRCAGDGLDTTVDILDPKIHEDANPSYGEIIDPAEIMKEARLAKDKPIELFTFLRYRLNIWTASVTSYILPDKWDACDDPVDEESLRGRMCFGGLDLSTRKDLTAEVLLFPPKVEGEKWKILCRCWLPIERARARSQREGMKFLLWAEQGFLNLTEGNETSYADVKSQLRADIEKFNIKGIGTDMWQAADISQQLDPKNERIVAVGQNMQDMSPPTKQLDTLALDGKLAHGGNPVLRWAIQNVKIIDDTNDNHRPTKKHSADKIDPAVALIMALGQAMIDHPTENAYATRGFRRL